MMGDTTGIEAVTDAPNGISESDTVLELDGVTKSYGSETALEDLSLTVREGELLTLLGPSGCGKTTTLRLLAGLSTPTHGTIDLDGKRIAGEESFVPPEERDIGLVFQEYALFPHLSVAENIAFGLSGMGKSEKNERVDALLGLVELPDVGDRSPENLSGGQRQRVALARSLAPEPDILLLDEPFSNLDARLRVDMRESVRGILKATGTTALSVTHDQEEAFSIGDRVAVMHEGRLEQIGTPEHVFTQPSSRFVAGFLGEANFLSGVIRGGHVDTEIGTIKTESLENADEIDQETIDILVRPDDLRTTPTNEETADGTVIHRRYSGPSFVYRIDVGGETVHSLHNHSEEFETDTPVDVSLVADHPLAWFPR